MGADRTRRSPYSPRRSPSCRHLPRLRARRCWFASTAVGTALVDARGRALYTRSIDMSRKSTCYGSCAAAWPPFLTSAKPLAGAGVKQALLGTSKRTNGTLQVTYAGHPLYYDGQHEQPGQITAQGTASTWWLHRARRARRSRSCPAAATSAPPRRRVWRDSGCVARPRWTPRCRVLGRPDRTTIGAPCVLASRRPSHPRNEHHPARPS